MGFLAREVEQKGSPVDLFRPFFIKLYQLAKLDQKPDVTDKSNRPDNHNE